MKKLGVLSLLLVAAMTLAATPGLAEMKRPVEFPTGMWKLRADPQVRADFAITRGSVKTFRKGGKLAAANLEFTIPADTAYADCPFTGATSMQLVGTLLVPRRMHNWGKPVISWEGWRNAELRSENGSYAARLFFFFPGNAYTRANPSPEFQVEVGGCHYWSILLG